MGSAEHGQFVTIYVILDEICGLHGLVEAGLHSSFGWRVKSAF